LALSLAISAHKDSGVSDDPNSLFFGTGWGPLSETYDFLTKLYESEEHFTSPTDFIGSVHNAPAGLIAIRFRSTGPNITTTGGDYSFEQSLMAASLLTKGGDDLILVVGADEYHEILSDLFDDSVWESHRPSDGGGALCLRRSDTPSGLKLFPSFFEYSKDNPSIISALIDSLGGPDRIKRRYGAVFAGIPGAHRDTGGNQLSQFLSGSGFEGPVIDYRRLTGEFASASAVAAVLAVCFAREGKIPEALSGRKSSCLDGKGILILGLGKFVTAVELITQD
jgi:3-oxoacyl-[acyl-carrier-protein] synthase-1/3-oxoacyl-[acyl-carrier-protein] synthase II